GRQRLRPKGHSEPFHLHAAWAGAAASLAQQAALQMLDRVGRDLQMALYDGAHDGNAPSGTLLLLMGEDVGGTRAQAGGAANTAQEVVVFAFEGGVHAALNPNL